MLKIEKCEEALSEASIDKEADDIKENEVVDHRTLD